MTILDKHITDIRKLCEKHQVMSLYAFGSVLTDSFNRDSDVDLIIDFKPIDVFEYADNYFDFKFSLQKILNRSIDLLEDKAIKNPYFRKSIHPKLQLIYGY